MLQQRWTHCQQGLWMWIQRAYISITVKHWWCGALVSAAPDAGGSLSVGRQGCLAGLPIRRVLGRTKHSPYNSMAASTSPGSEDAGQRHVTNEDHPRQETSAADYCGHVSCKFMALPSSSSGTSSRLQRAPYAMMQGVSGTHSVCAQFSKGSRSEITICLQCSYAARKCCTR